MLYLCTAAQKRPGGLLAGYGQQLLVTATATGGLTGMRKNNPLLPVFCTGTAARSRPNFDDVIRADKPPTSKFTYFEACQLRISSLTISRFRALNLEHFGSDLLPISRFSSEFRKLRPKFVLKFQYSDRAHHANYSIC